MGDVVQFKPKACIEQENKNTQAKMLIHGATSTLLAMFVDAGVDITDPSVKVHLEKALTPLVDAALVGLGLNQ